MAGRPAVSRRQPVFGQLSASGEKWPALTAAGGLACWCDSAGSGAGATADRGCCGQHLVGGIETTRSLFLAGIVDALTLTVHPVATPEGRRLFDESVPVTRLRLIDSAITSAGNAVLTYALRD